MNTTLYGFHPSQYPRKSRKSAINQCLKYVPWITLTLTIALFCWTLWTLVSQECNIFMFLLLSAKLYLNWFAVMQRRGKFDPSTLQQQSRTNHTTQAAVNSPQISLQRVWFCTKCKIDTFYECHHCPLCEVCIIQRDHHCFFLGTCITRQNMKHFIVFCVYAALVCFYTGVTLISDLSLPHLSLYFLPVCIGYFLSGYVPLITLINVLITNVVISTAFLTLCFGVYQVGVVCLAKLPYSSELEKSNSYMDNLLSTFDGPSGLLNFMFPLGLLFIEKKQINSNKFV